MEKPACFNKKKNVKLIKLYEFHRCLWDNTVINYRNKVLRQAAWKTISNEMKMPIEILKHKMKTLLATNRKERSKRKKSLSGSGVYKSKWFAAKYFTFLNNKNKRLQTGIAMTTSNVDTENVNESLSDDEDSDLDSDSSLFLDELSSVLTTSTQKAPIQQTPKNSAASTQQQHNTDSFRNKRSRNEDGTDTNLTEAVGLLKHSVQYLSKEEDCYTSFGNNIAHELKKYDTRTFSLVKHAINNIIFQADMGQLPGQSCEYTRPYSTDLTISTSQQSNYSDISNPAEMAHTSAPEPQREAGDAQNENYELIYVTIKEEKNNSENS